MNLQLAKKFRNLAQVLCIAGLLAVLLPVSHAQETTGALQGTVKDAAGAVVPHATVKLETPSLPGGKTTETDGKGYYHFANLPPGAYVITVDADGFSELKREGLILEVGHAPTIDLPLSAGAKSTVVEVSAESPQIDVTSVTSQTNVTSDVLDLVPHGTSFQSVIQFAPAARNEPLMGGGAGGGNGSCSPGSCTSGNANGYSIGGASDSENSYLVEGQETADVIGGYSHTNMPLEFIEEVQVKTSGIEAQHGGALGGVVNAIVQKGSSRYHGAVFSDFSTDKLNSGPNGFLSYDPTSNLTPTTWGLLDTAPRYYRSQKAHYSDVFPGLYFGGPLLGPLVGHLGISDRWNEKIFLFAGFKPELQRDEVFVNYGAANGGIIPFSQNTNTYYGTARLDAKVSKRVSVFGSWLTEFQKQNGETLPGVDSVTGQLNTSVANPPSTYAHTQGYSAPNTTLNTGADITISNSLVSTTRFGYFFENYHDFGYPTGGTIQYFATNGVGQVAVDGSALPASLAQPQYTLETNGVPGGSSISLTSKNASKSIHLDTDLAWYKSTKFGTHNFRFGYQLNRNSNDIIQAYNEPFVEFDVGNTVSYTPAGPVGTAACNKIKADRGYKNCEGNYGYVVLNDYGTGGKATSYNHSFYGQDSWTIGKGLTIDAGVRVEKEFVPGEGLTGPGVPSKPINFGWGDKIAPRIGVSYDVFKDGKMKIFGSYGVFVDQMKLNVAISSFGGQYWQECTYALDTANVGSVNATFDSNHRYCTGASSSDQGNFSGGTTAPAGLTFLENYNLRAFPTTCSTCSFAQEGVAPGLKPYREHNDVFGIDYQLRPNLTLEGRYDRKRLDNVIEDSAIFNPNVGETFVIVNPGQGSNGTFEGFCQFLYGPDPVTGGTNSGCLSSSGYPPTQTIPAARNYDSVEIRLTKAQSHNWFGLFSYTYSHLRGNYTGLTTSDQSDGIGRNAPNNSRAFDEPYFSWNSQGYSSSGLLPTDRPNAFKGDAYYRFNYLKKFSTDLGIFQTAYAGSPRTTYMDIGYGGGFPVQIFNRGTWADISQNPDTGAITVGTPRLNRNPWYIQSDLNVTQSYKISESKVVSFTGTFTNALNQHAVVAVFEQVDSGYLGNQYGTPQGQAIFAGAAFYAAAESPYNITNLLNSNNSQGGPISVNSQYGKPILWQQPRSLRLQVKFQF
jgi:hypothetical protein